MSMLSDLKDSVVNALGGTIFGKILGGSIGLQVGGLSGAAVGSGNPELLKATLPLEVAVAAPIIGGAVGIAGPAVGAATVATGTVLKAASTQIIKSQTPDLPQSNSFPSNGNYGAIYGLSPAAYLPAGEFGGDPIFGNDGGANNTSGFSPLWIVAAVGAVLLFAVLFIRGR